jgi:hypothetical protein
VEGGGWLVVVGAAVVVDPVVVGAPVVVGPGGRVV